MLFRAFYRACGVCSKIHNLQNYGGTSIGPVQDSTIHIWHQSQPKLKDLAYGHVSNDNQNIQFNKHRNQNLSNQEQEEREIEPRTWN